MSWLREAISDDVGQADMAYIAIGALSGAAIGSLVFICSMSAVAYFRCVPLVKADVVVNCTYDPLPTGQAAGLIFAAFGALIGALAGYMAATRRATQKNDQTVIAPQAQAVVQVQPAEVKPKPKRKR